MSACILFSSFTFGSSFPLPLVSFSTVVVILKILLSQHRLDKPFTGGIGSYALYVLVSSHVRLFQSIDLMSSFAFVKLIATHKIRFLTHLMDIFSFFSAKNVDRTTFEVGGR